MQHVFLLTVLIEVASSDSHARTNQRPHRSTIVHLFEWKWKDIADECERFLGPKGFGAVQVSPPSENLIMRLKHLKNTRPWYERYRPMSYKINTRSGNEEEFVDMTTRCNKVGVRIYADVVLNHMAGDYCTNIGTAGSTADFQKYQYPAVPYKREHFHEPCTINFNIAKQVRECQLVGTKDLNHKNEHVRGRIVDYLNKLLDLGVAGFRIDAAKHIWPDDLRDIYSQLHYFEDAHLSRSKPYLYHEVTYNATGEAVKPFEYTELGDVADYRVGAELKNFFRGLDTLKLLHNWGPDWGLLPSGNAVISIDNHETQREDDVLTYKEPKAYKAATAFILAHPYGEPRVMSSYYFDKWEQGPPSDKDGNILSPNSAGCNRSQKSDTHGNGWVCEHRWRQIYQMVAFRNAVRGSDVTRWWDNGNNLIAFSRGDKGFVAFNLEDGKDMNATVKTALPAGEYCDVISGERHYDRCTGRKVMITEQREGRRIADIRILAHDEDMHIAIHVGPESSLQTDWTPSDTGGRPPTDDLQTVDQQMVDQQMVDQQTVDQQTVDCQTTDDNRSWLTSDQQRWHRERDPLPPLTSEPERIVPYEKQEKNGRQTSHKHRWHRERDPLPPLTSELANTVACDPLPPSTSTPTSNVAWIKQEKESSQTGQQPHQECDSLPPLTSEPARIVPYEKQENNGRQSIQKHRWHRERDPLPPLTSELASTVAWINQEKEGRQTGYRWRREYDSLPLTFEPAQMGMEKQEKKGRQTNQEHRWHRVRDPLPSLTSEPARAWKNRRKLQIWNPTSGN